MEPDFHRLLGPRAIVSTTRIFLEHVTREAEQRMLAEDLPRAAELMRTTSPDAVVFGCTSAGSLSGLSHDAEIGRRLEQTTGARAITVLHAVVGELARIRPLRLAVFTPYLADLTASVAQCVAEAGHQVVKAEGMGLRYNLDIGRVSPGEIATFVETHLSGTGADCVFLSCTNWRSLETIPSLETRLGVPVISSNQAALAMLLAS